MMRPHVAVMAILVYITVALASPLPVSADLGNCTAYDGNQPHQGGSEPDVTSTSRGVYGKITVRFPDLCNTPQVGPFGWDTASTVYVMLTNYSVVAWYQAGYYRLKGQGASRHYMQYYTGGPAVYTDEAPCCAQAGTKYRYYIRKLSDDAGFYWESKVVRDSDGVLIYGFAGDPTTLGFTPADAEYSSEVINEHDQSGGGNASRAKLEGAGYYDAALTLVNANIPAGDRFCQMCNPSTNGFPIGPYNTNWINTNTFEVWTDGF